MMMPHSQRYQRMCQYTGHHHTNTIINVRAVNVTLQLLQYPEKAPMSALYVLKVPSFSKIGMIPTHSVNINMHRLENST